MRRLTIFVRNALVIALALGSVGCESSKPEPTPVSRHIVYVKLDGERGIWIADREGREARLLVRGGRSPELSPDGKRVAYLDGCTTATGPCSMYLVASEGGKPRLLARGTFGKLTWSPTSNRVAASRLTREGGAALVSIDASSGEAATLTSGSLYGWSFSPDGTRIVFAQAEPNPNAFSVSDEQVDLFVSDPEGGGVKRITESGDNGYPVWGPESIAFARLVPGRDEIWRIAPDGKGRETITGRTPERLLGKGYEGLIPIGWSDDGSALLAALMDEGETKWSSFAVDPETGRLRELLGGGSRTVALSRDGRFVLVESEPTGGLNDWTVGIVPYAGGKPRIVARGAFDPTWNH